MAIRLPVYERHVQLDSGAHTIARIHADDATGRAISRIGESMISVAAHWKAKQEQFDKFQAAEQLTVLKTQLGQIALEVSNEYQPGKHPPNWMHEQIVARSKPLIAAWVSGVPESQRDRAVVHGKTLGVEIDVGSAQKNSQVDKEHYKGQVEKIASGYAASLKNNPEKFNQAVAEYDDYLKSAVSIPPSERETLRRAHLKTMFDAAITGFNERGEQDKARALTDEFTERMNKEDATQRGALQKQSESGYNEKRVAQIDSKPEIKAAIEAAAKATGMDANVLKTVASIESGGDASSKSNTGSYKGLFQLSNAEFQRGGGGNIYSAADNAMAAAKVLAQHAAKFEQTNGRPPTASDLYLIHQQGEAGAAAHTKNPDQPAWRSMFSTAEGQQKGENWAKKAIWGNIPDDLKRQFGGVDNVTSRDFMALWKGKVEGRTPAAVAAAPKTGVFTEEETGTRKIQTAEAKTATATDATKEVVAEAKTPEQAPDEPPHPKIIKDEKTGQLRQETTEEVMARSKRDAEQTPVTPRPDAKVIAPTVAPASKSYWDSVKEMTHTKIDGSELKMAGVASSMKKKLEETIKKDIASTAQTGEDFKLSNDLKRYFGTENLSYELIANKLGEGAAITWEEGKQDAAKYHNMTADLHEMPNSVIEERKAAMRPSVIVEGSRETKLYQDFVKRADDLQASREKDPASAVDMLPNVREAYERLAKTPATDVTAHNKAANDLITERLAAQRYLGIPSHLQQPLTLRESQELAAPLLDRSSDDIKTTELIQERIKAIAGGNTQIARKMFEGILVAAGKKAEEAKVAAAGLSLPPDAPVPMVDDPKDNAFNPKAARIREDLFADPLSGALFGPVNLGGGKTSYRTTGMEDPEDVRKLLQDPSGSMKRHFDEAYAPGAADFYLNQANQSGTPVAKPSDDYPGAPDSSGVIADTPGEYPGVPDFDVIDLGTEIPDAGGF